MVKKTPKTQTSLNCFLSRCRADTVYVKPVIISGT